MRLTVIPDDDVVVIDGDARKVDCAPLRLSGVHAVQWDGVEGAVEFKRGSQVALASVLPGYGRYIDAHAQRRAADDAAAAAAASSSRRDVFAELDSLRALVGALDGK